MVCFSWVIRLLLVRFDICWRKAGAAMDARAMTAGGWDYKRGFGSDRERRREHLRKSSRHFRGLCWAFMHQGRGTRAAGCHGVDCVRADDTEFWLDPAVVRRNDTSALVSCSFCFSSSSLIHFTWLCSHASAALTSFG